MTATNDPWIKLSVNATENPKCVGLSDAAWTLWIHGLTYAGRNLSDGFIPDGIINRLCNTRHPRKAADELVKAGLWDTYDGGWVIHDYLEHQRSANDVEQQSESARKGAGKTNHTRWHVGKKHDPECRWCVADSDGTAIADGSLGQSQIRDLLTSSSPLQGSATRPDDDRGQQAARLAGIADHERARSDGVEIKSHTSYRRQCIANRLEECIALASTYPAWTVKQIADRVIEGVPPQPILPADAPRPEPKAHDGCPPPCDGVKGHLILEDGVVPHGCPGPLEAAS